MLHLLQLNKYYPPYRGGIEEAVETITDLLHNMMTIDVLVCRDRFTSVIEKRGKTNIYRCGRILKIGPMPVSCRYIFMLRKISRNIDLVLLHMPFPWGDLALRLSGYKGKVALWWHSDIVRQKRLTKLYNPLLQWTLNRADIIFVGTQGNIDGSDYLKRYEEKCCIIPFAVKDAFLLDGNRKKLKSPGDPIRFLFVGRMVYYKGCEVLIRAFAKMREKNCILNMVGSKTKVSDSCEKLSDELGIANRVCFCGDVSEKELMEYYYSSDVFVLPSTHKSEAFALVQLEAMAYGKPVINTNLPSGVPYVSINNETGFTVEPMDVDALSKAMDILADNDELRNRFGEAARKRVKQLFTREIMKNNLIEALIKLCDKQ